MLPGLSGRVKIFFGDYVPDSIARHLDLTKPRRLVLLRLDKGGA